MEILKCEGECVSIGKANSTIVQCTMYVCAVFIIEMIVCPVWKSQAKVTHIDARTHAISIEAWHRQRNTDREPNSFKLLFIFLKLHIIYITVMHEHKSQRNREWIKKNEIKKNNYRTGTQRCFGGSTLKIMLKSFLLLSFSRTCNSYFIMSAVLLKRIT